MSKLENIQISKSLRNYILFFVGQQFSLLGSNIVQFAVIVWITIETKSELYLSLAALLGFGPQVILTMVGGVAADKYNKKTIIALTDTMQAVVTLTLIFIIKSNSNQAITYILVITSLRGIFNAFHSPTTRSLIPIMIPQKHLSQINSLISLSNSIILALGPIIAGSLLTILSLHSIMWIDIITWIIAMLPLIFIKIPSINNDKEKANKKESFFSSLKYGIYFLTNRSSLFTFILVAAFLNFFGVSFGILLPSFIILENNGTEQIFGILSAIIQSGIIISSLLIIFLPYLRRNKIKMIIPLWYIELTGLSIVALAPVFFHNSNIGVFWIIGLGLLIFGLSNPIINVMFITHIQRSIPMELQGRVMSVLLTIVNILTPLGMILSGIFAELISNQMVFIISVSSSCLILSLYWVLFDLDKLNLKETEGMKEMEV